MKSKKKNEKRGENKFSFFFIFLYSEKNKKGRKILFLNIQIMLRKFVIADQITNPVIKC